MQQWPARAAGDPPALPPAPEGGPAAQAEAAGGGLGGPGGGGGPGGWGPPAPGHPFSGWSTFVRRLGLPKVRFHDLRHAHATLLLLAGINPKVVSERLGHASVGITLDIYSHVLPS